MGEILSLVTALSSVNSMHQNQLKADADAAAKQKAQADVDAQKKKLQEDEALAQTQEASAQNDYKIQMDTLNKQFDMNMSENEYTDASGNTISENAYNALNPTQQAGYKATPTDLGNMMKQITNNFMQTSTTAIRQWAAERGVAGSTIEGQAVQNASTEATKSALGYKTGVQGQLASEKQALVNDSGIAYNQKLGSISQKLGVDTSLLNVDVNQQNAAQNQENRTAYDPSTDLAAFLGNIGKLIPTATTQNTQTITGNNVGSGSEVRKAGTIFESDNKKVNS